MTKNGMHVPTTIAMPRCFLLRPVFEKDQAFSQAGEHKSKVFGFDIKRAFNSLSKKSDSEIKVELLHMRLVPFWQIRCRSHFDYARLQEYSITAKDKEAQSITIQGTNQQNQPQEIILKVDTGRSEGKVNLTGFEKIVSDRQVDEWIDSYVNTENFPEKNLDKHQNQLRLSALQNPELVENLEEFVLDVTEKPLTGDVKVLIVPPLEKAENVIRRILP